MNAVEVYNLFAPYYDDYVGSFQADIPMYMELCRGRNPVCEIGCGTGRVLSPLLDAGHELLGVDVSGTMLSLAEKKLAGHMNAGRLRLLRHDLCRAPLRDPFPVMLVTFYTFNYMLADDDAAAFLRSAFLSMQDGGIIVLDLFFPREAAWEKKTIQSGGRPVTLSLMRVVRDGIETRTQVFSDGGGPNLTITTRRRHYGRAQIRRHLERAGFLDVEFTAGYDMESFRAHMTGEAETPFTVRARKG